MTAFEPALAIVRALQAGSAMLLFGELLYGAWIARAGDVHAGAAWRPRSARTLGAALLVVAISALAWLVMESAVMSGRPWVDSWHGETLGTVLARTLFGHVWLVRGALLVALAAVLGLARGRAGAPGPAAALAAALLASLAWAGHANAQTGIDGAIHHVADAMHLLAAGAWLGGLAAFAATLRPGPGDGVPPHAIRAVQRYASLAAACVAVIVASGVVNAYYTLGAPARLLDTTYGSLLLSKLALFAAALAVAAVNRWRLTPALLRGPASASPARIAAQQLRRAAWIEQAIGLAIVLLAGALGTAAPPMRM